MLAEQSGTGDLVAYVVRRMPCPDCGGSYTSDDVVVARHADGIWYLGATCPACHHARTITAYDRPPYERLPLSSFRARGAITPADVAAWRAFLAGYSGDLRGLIRAL